MDTRSLRHCSHYGKIIVNKKKKKFLTVFVGVLISLIGIAGGVFLYIVHWPFQPAKDARKVNILVRWGATYSQVASQMEEKNIIRDSSQFLLTVKVFNKENALRAGKFTLKQGMSHADALYALTEGPQSFFKITFPEGYPTDKYASIVTDSLNVDSSRIVHLVTDSTFIAKLGLETESLEGYVYPETYHFTYGVNESQILKTAVDQFKKVTSDSLWQEAAKKDLTQNKVLTLASIIEGEAMLDREMPIISSVYHNRLERGMKLQADPTIQYLISDGPRRLLNRDLEIDSPYNTYKYAGLPPGPINNPGIRAIRAAVFPEETNYLYFVAKGDGSHTFSESYQQHIRAKAEFDKIRRKVAREKKEEKQQN